MTYEKFKSPKEITANASTIASYELREATKNGVDTSLKHELTRGELDRVINRSIARQRRLDAKKRNPFHNADHELMVVENGIELAERGGVANWLAQTMHIGHAMHDFRHPGFVRPVVDDKWTNEEYSAVACNAVMTACGFSPYQRVLGYGGIIGTTFRPDNSIKPETDFETLFAVADLGVSISRRTYEEWIRTSAGVTAELTPEKRVKSIQEWIRNSELWFFEFVKSNRWHGIAEQAWGNMYRQKVGILHDLLRDERSHPKVMELIREHVEPLLQAA